MWPLRVLPDANTLVYLALYVSLFARVQARLYDSLDKLPNSTYDFIIVGGE
jgi:hypothetical protein